MSVYTYIHIYERERERERGREREGEIAKIASILEKGSESPSFFIEKADNHHKPFLLFVLR